MQQKILYFISIVFTVYLGLVAYAGLSSVVAALPSVEFINQIGDMWFVLNQLLETSFFNFFPLLLLGIVPICVFARKDFSLMFLILTVIFLAVIAAVLFFPSIFG